MPSATCVARGRPRSSSAPAMTSVGARMVPSLSCNGSIVPWPAPRRLAARLVRIVWRGGSPAAGQRPPARAPRGTRTRGCAPRSSRSPRSPPARGGPPGTRRPSGEPGPVRGIRDPRGRGSRGRGGGRRPGARPRGERGAGAHRVAQEVGRRDDEATEQRRQLVGMRSIVIRAGPGSRSNRGPRGPDDHPEPAGESGGVAAPGRPAAGEPVERSSGSPAPRVRASQRRPSMPIASRLHQRLPSAAATTPQRPGGAHVPRRSVRSSRTRSPGSPTEQRSPDRARGVHGGARRRAPPRSDRRRSRGASRTAPRSAREAPSRVWRRSAAGTRRSRRRRCRRARSSRTGHAAGRRPARSDRGGTTGRPRRGPPAPRDGRRAKGGRDHPVDPHRAAIGADRDRSVGRGQPAVEVAHRHRVAGPQHGAIRKRLASAGNGAPSNGSSSLASQEVIASSAASSARRQSELHAVSAPAGPPPSLAPTPRPSLPGPHGRTSPDQGGLAPAPIAIEHDQLRSLPSSSSTIGLEVGIAPVRITSSGRWSRSTARAARAGPRARSPCPIMGTGPQPRQRVGEDREPDRLGEPGKGPASRGSSSGPRRSARAASPIPTQAGRWPHPAPAARHVRGERASAGVQSRMPAASVGRTHGPSGSSGSRNGTLTWTGPAGPATAVATARPTTDRTCARVAGSSSASGSSVYHLAAARRGGPGRSSGGRRGPGARPVGRR